jgi:uncharacterized protein (TIGR02145 family)
MVSKKRLFILIGGLVLSAVVLLVSFLLTNMGRSNLGGALDFQCGDKITYQENVYKTVQIGEQCWMKENLKTTKYRDGTPISVSDSMTDSEWIVDKKGAYVCYQNIKENCNNYGALYNWYAVSNVLGLCPAGWSVPTHNKWTDLERSICKSLKHENCETIFAYDNSMGFRGTDEGKNLKSKTVKGSDAYGFSAFLGGFRNPNGPFQYLGEKGFWWTSDFSGEFAYGRVLDASNQGVRQVESVKSSGFSVRCVKD